MSSERPSSLYLFALCRLEAFHSPYVDSECHSGQSMGKDGVDHSRRRKHCLGSYYLLSGTTANITNKNNHLRKRLFNFTLLGYSPSSRKLNAEASSRIHGGMLLISLLPGVLTGLCLVFIQPITICLRIAGSSVFPQQTAHPAVTLKMIFQTCPNRKSSFMVCFIRVSQMTLDYVKLVIRASQDTPSLVN